MTEALDRALRLAVEAARQAGAMLREEFHRPGGPRGAGSHADIDLEAEQTIRETLTAAFPEWAYLGEETGAGTGGGSALRWLVDPNDGTRSFLKGLRGTAVSIALVKDGVPVLGVVYAPTAPDDDGDLFTWAEGCRLTRNGIEVHRQTFPARLGPLDVVLISQDADLNPAANAECVAPARFRAVPSIAYRLALVAVGEGDTAVSLNGPIGWDLAGGHALLRAVGGEVVDESGAPIRYRTGGEGGGQVFGGAIEVARALATRPWAKVMRADGPGPLTRLKGPRVRDAGRLARAQGCLLGQVAGDSMGALVEFSSAAAIARKYPDGIRDLADGGYWNILAGQPTDDSEMALALARALVREGGFKEEGVFQAYREWVDSGPFDCGSTVGSALRGRLNPGSKANGALMRAAPLGILAHGLTPQMAADLARRDAALTHPNPACLDANAAYVVAIAHAIQTGAGAHAAYREALRWAEEANAATEVVSALREAERTAPEHFNEQDRGLVTIALQNAFHVLLHAGSAEAGVRRTVAQGGDTDTNGAIAGALLGAVHGRDAVPLQWRRAVLSARALPGTPHPRPAWLWPVEVQELAEALLLAGRR